MIDRPIARDRQQPGPQRAAPCFKGVDAIPDPKECFLHQILGGRGIAHDRENDGISKASEAIVEIRHGVADPGAAGVARALHRVLRSVQAREIIRVSSCVEISDEHTSCSSDLTVRQRGSVRAARRIEIRDRYHNRTDSASLHTSPVQVPDSLHSFACASRRMRHVGTQVHFFLDIHVVTLYMNHTAIFKIANFDIGRINR